jgi:hypothetical protein
VAVMAALRHVSWFSILAFGLAVVPATIVLLAFELRLQARGLGGDLHLEPAGGKAA